MNLKTKYDVFVSYSRKDYVDEAGIPIEGSPVSALLSFLNKNGISYWIDKEGIYSGSEFAELLADAITDSKLMIFVSSEHSNSSKWTAGEIFEALEQDKLIIPFKIDDSPYNKKYRMMVRPLDYIEYFSNSESAFALLLKSINACKAEYENALAEEQKRMAAESARLQEIQNEIKTDAVEYNRHASTLASYAQKIIEKQIQIGNTDKKCPICEASQPIENRYCKICGWTFNPVFEAKPKGDKDQIFLMRGIWNTVNAPDSAKEQLESKVSVLEGNICEKEKQINALQDQLADCRQSSQKLEAELKAYKDKELQQQNVKVEDEKRPVQSDSPALMACTHEGCRIYGQRILPPSCIYCPECVFP